MSSKCSFSVYPLTGKASLSEARDSVCGEEPEEEGQGDAEMRTYQLSLMCCVVTARVSLFDS